MPLLLDLFCCQGGAALGYHRAGFDVVGVDLEAQPLYPFEFVQGDALDFFDPRFLGRFDAIHASPPCQSYSTMNGGRGSTKPALIAAVRELLDATGKPYVIENVTGARREMSTAVLLHGGMFELRTTRPRLIETNWGYEPPPKCPRPKDPLGIYGHHEQQNRVLWRRKDGSVQLAATLAEAREILGMPHADWRGVCEAVPPAYTEHVGHQLLGHLT